MQTLPDLSLPSTPPAMLHPGGIEHFIKTGQGLGSNVTVLSRSLSIPPWPFVVFNFAGCQAWPCRRMEGTQRSRAVRVTQWQLSHKPRKSRPFSAPQRFNYYLSMLELPALRLRIRRQMMMSNYTSLTASSSLIYTYFLCGVSTKALELNNKWGKYKYVLFFPIYFFLCGIWAQNPFPENPITLNKNEWLLPPISMQRKWKKKWNRLKWVKAYLFLLER